MYIRTWMLLALLTTFSVSIAEKQLIQEFVQKEDDEEREAYFTSLSLRERLSLYVEIAERKSRHKDQQDGDVDYATKQKAIPHLKLMQNTLFTDVTQEEKMDLLYDVIRGGDADNIRYLLYHLADQKPEDKFAFFKACTEGDNASRMLQLFWKHKNTFTSQQKKYMYQFASDIMRHYPQYVLHRLYQNLTLSEYKRVFQLAFDISTTV